MKGMNKAAGGRKGRYHGIPIWFGVVEMFRNVF